MTLQQALDVTRDIMNAGGPSQTASGQWTDSIMKRWIGHAHWAEYGDLLNVNRTITFQQVSVTQDSSGRFTLASLNQGSGDSAVYAYRILSVSQPGSPAAQIQFFYRKAQYRQFPNPQPNTSLPYIWYRAGAYIQVMPVASGQGLTITTNYRPERADRLAGVGSLIDFPDGYEEVFCWRAAVLALTKGGNEADAARDIQAQYKTMHDDMLLDLGRESDWPIIAEAHDMPEDWGG